MENYNKAHDGKSGRIWGGIVLLLVGVALLMNNIIPGLPHWIFSWRTLLILIGLVLGIKSQFRNTGWFILVLIGSYFTLDKAFENYVDFEKIGFPILLLILGAFILLRPKKQPFCKKEKKWKYQTRYTTPPPPTEDSGAPVDMGANTAEPSSLDYLESVNVFGGTNQRLFTKNFKGGEIVAVFGGCEVNLSQCDFQGVVTLEVVAIFGGTKIVVPPGWVVKSEVTAILGGLDDKRAINPHLEDHQKMLIIKGVALFGGVEIRNF